MVTQTRPAIPERPFLILGAGPEQIPAIRTAQSLGLGVIALDASSHAPGFQIADASLHVNIHDAENIIRRLGSTSPVGVLAHAVEAAVPAARLAQRFGLPGIPPLVAERATNKVLRSNRLREAGIRVPRATTCDLSDLDSCLMAFGLPAVVKPDFGAGARGVLHVRWRNEIQTVQRFYREAGHKTLLIEEFLEGPEISTGAFVQGARITTFAFADRNYMRKTEFYPNFIEDGIDFPTNLDPTARAAIVAITEEAIRALGIRQGAAKGDVILTQDGPVVIEMAARSSGGWFSAGSIRIATGVDIISALVRQAVGQTVDPALLQPKRDLHCAQRYLIPTESGWFGSVDGVRTARSLPGVEMLTLTTPMANAWIRRAESHGDRLAQVICTGVSRAEAAARASNAIQALSISYSNGAEVVN